MMFSSTSKLTPVFFNFVQSSQRQVGDAERGIEVSP
jgi:hypothetical protein